MAGMSSVIENATSQSSRSPICTEPKLTFSSVLPRTRVSSCKRKLNAIKEKLLGSEKERLDHVNWKRKQNILRDRVRGIRRESTSVDVCVHLIGEGDIIVVSKGRHDAPGLRW